MCGRTVSRDPDPDPPGPSVTDVIETPLLLSTSRL